jgi:hypothetical protein
MKAFWKILSVMSVATTIIITARCGQTTQQGSQFKTFVTATTHQGNFGAVANADSICQADANKPSAGLYKAMVVYSNGTRVACTSPDCSRGINEHTDWVLRPNTTYVRSDGSTVVGTTNSVGLFTFPLLNSYSSTSSNVWTGLETGWTSANNWGNDWDCTNWTSTAAFAPPGGATGKTDSTDSTAIAFTLNCSNARSLLCVEQ